ncbi:HAMP domain-containing sensor histidine kinase [Paenibacillus sp. B01]|uniref:HAMP domain-containing sensor histidine kinase n=1 Tax=Paenibacillus sp. B01 TaxID=2660554 RepID=UPI00129B70A0|nr:HAMP domain-containing sensor histidine kinase [Paenibacillus sp. B01]QGG54505.1 HAMP domain-containing protein [Paenibacillus sp. B01]
MSRLPSPRRLLRRLRRPSLLLRYGGIVLSAIILLPLLLMLVGVVTMTSLGWLWPRDEPSIYSDTTKLRLAWEAEAAAMGGESPAEAAARMAAWKERYPRAYIFRVDAEGRLRDVMPARKDLPSVWSAAYTVEYMKDAVSGDRFTVVSFVGSSRTEGFIAMEVPRYLTLPYSQRMDRVSGGVYAGGVLLMLGLFLLVSMLFFLRIRRRLVRLQAAMERPSAGGLPEPVELSGADEIGRLEGSFNGMVRQLEDARRRERQEEELRRDLIARLSHDLRTPLTVLRAHAHTLAKEPLGPSGRESLALMTGKLDYLSEMMENLFSYNLLSAGKYPYRPERLDAARLVRTQLAAWYPAFEQAGLELESDLPEEPLWWTADPRWLERVLDNLLLNVLRHAAAGGWCAVRLSPEAGGTLRVEDRGPGMDAPSAAKGSGLGLAIAELMLREQGLSRTVRSSPEGTVVEIRPAERAGADSAAGGSADRGADQP